jgi:hypothetical protein
MIDRTDSARKLVKAEANLKTLQEDALVRYERKIKATEQAISSMELQIKSFQDDLANLLKGKEDVEEAIQAAKDDLAFFTEELNA